jgi:uncharacterized RDD family membrane protein YckC
MNDKSVKNEDGTLGVYFSQNDYASLLLRFLIIGIDAAVLLAISIIIGLILYPINRGFDTLIGHTITVMIPISYLYLAIYKRTDQSTLGYRFLGVKIINLEGKRPSIWQMTLRFLILFFGPFNFFVDILWLTGEENKQTLRDKMFGTYVIKRQAQVKGTGKIIYYQQMFLGWNWMFREVERTSTE